MDTSRKRANVDIDQIHISRSKLWKYTLIILGSIFWLLGILGIFLPLLPTTPFLLLAAACYARGSEKFYRMLLNSRVFGPYILQWRQDRSIPLRAKASAILLIVVTMSISVIFFIEFMPARVILGVIGVVVIIFLLRIPTRNF